jgi:hypothetical protein
MLKWANGVSWAMAKSYGQFYGFERFWAAKNKANLPAFGWKFMP